MVRIILYLLIDQCLRTKLIIIIDLNLGSINN